MIPALSSIIDIKANVSIILNLWTKVNMKCKTYIE